MLEEAMTKEKIKQEFKQIKKEREEDKKGEEEKEGEEEEEEEDTHEHDLGTNAGINSNIQDFFVTDNPTFKTMTCIKKLEFACSIISLDIDNHLSATYGMTIWDFLHLLGDVGLFLGSKGQFEGESFPKYLWDIIVSDIQEHRHDRIIPFDEDSDSWRIRRFIHVWNSMMSALHMWQSAEFWSARALFVPDKDISFWREKASETSTMQYISQLTDHCTKLAKAFNQRLITYHLKLGDACLNSFMSSGRGFVQRTLSQQRQ